MSPDPNERFVMSNTVLGNMIRVGVVRAVDSVNRKARVWFDDIGIPSGWLFVLKHGDDWMPGIGDRVLTAKIPVENGDGFILGGY